MGVSRVILRFLRSCLRRVFNLSCLAALSLRDIRRIHHVANSQQPVMMTVWGWTPSGTGGGIWTGVSGSLSR